MALSLKESQAVTELAHDLYDFLPANPYPGANQNISFPGVAKKMGLDRYWPGGSKRPAITTLLNGILEYERSRFCGFMLETVKTSMTYRHNKSPLTRQEIEKINASITKVGFKIPELWDPGFLDGLPSQGSAKSDLQDSGSKPNVAHLKQDFFSLLKLEPRQRGFAFEKFLKELFSAFGLAPHSSFRLVGEQIDGSLQIDTDTYLIEAKWTQEPIGQSDLLVFRGKVEAKSTWSRGIFVSYSGFSMEGIEAFSRGRSTNLISITGEDLHFVLEGQISLPTLIRKKARRAAETGAFFVRAYDLLEVTK